MTYEERGITGWRRKMGKEETQGAILFYLSCVPCNNQLSLCAEGAEGSD